MTFTFPIIALEEHFLADAVVEAYAVANITDPYEGSVVLRRCRANLVEVGDIRLDSMKEYGVSVQVLSPTPSASTCHPALKSTTSWLNGSPLGLSNFQGLQRFL